MKTSPKTSNKAALLLVALMLTIIPNLKIYAALGSYQSTSLAITANQEYSPQSYGQADAAWPAAIIYAVATYIGVADNPDVHQVSGQIDDPATLEFRQQEAAEASNFSKFDN